RYRHQPDGRHLVGARQPEKERRAVEGMGGQDAGGIAAEAEEGRMTEGDEPSKSQRYVEPRCGERQDGDARRQRDVEWLACRLRGEGGGEERGEEADRDGL